MFAQCGKTGDNEGAGKEKKQIPRRNRDQINSNDCEEKGHYDDNSDCPTQDKLKEDAEASRKTKK